MKRPRLCVGEHGPRAAYSPKLHKTRPRSKALPCFMRRDCVGRESFLLSFPHALLSLASYIVVLATVGAARFFFSTTPPLTPPSRRKGKGDKNIAAISALAALP